jgi:replicative DNA helicase
MNTSMNFSKYGRSFQETLAYLLLIDRPFSEQMDDVLDIKFFELKYLRLFVERIFSYRKKYASQPTKKILLSILRTELEDENEVSQKQVRDYFARVCATCPTDTEYVKETALDFCKKQKLKEAMVRSVSLLQNSSFDEIKDVIDVALKLGLDNNFGHDYKKDFELRYQIKARNPVSTGWDKIDKICNSGLGKGELGVVIAPTGAGKSMVLTHLGTMALKEGMNVVHYTLELSEECVGQRYDSCVSGIRLSDLFMSKEKVHEECVEVPGNLIIKEYPTKTASVNTLEAHLEKLKKSDQKIDLIIVDYGDLLKSATNYKEKRQELESIYESLRALAQKFECPLWTASQTNRSGLNAEVITMESISEAFNKCFVADFIFSISRTVRDKNTNTGRLFVAKNRNGPDGMIYPIFMDPGSVKIEILEPTGETPDELRINGAKQEIEDLKVRYKNFRKQKGKNNGVT